ncbi:MAG: hypothetical protein H6736_19735 [Alphaproteobacteria bacterium]|nr:hypothetical protein [Alphaproteobacteria bacterium]
MDVHEQPAIDVSRFATLTADGVVRVDQERGFVFGQGDWILMAPNGPTAMEVGGRVEVHLGEKSTELQLDVAGTPVQLAAGVWIDRSDYSIAESWACALDVWGSIACAGTGRWSDLAFDDGPYERVVGEAASICVQRVRDHLITCVDGTELDWGPLRDLTLSTLDYWSDEVGWWVGPFDPGFRPSLCGITEANEIRCDGPGYAPEVLEALDALPL